jgi:hypothetical protein
MALFFRRPEGLPLAVNSNVPGIVSGYGLVADGHIEISGGTFQGGSGLTAGIGGETVTSTGLGTISISNGNFLGGNGTTVAFLGGTGLVVIANTAGISGGTFSGGINGGTQGESLLYEGYDTGKGSSLSISGGLFSGEIGFDLYSPLNSLSFFGSGFDLTANGTLTGTLADRTPINTVLDSFAGAYSTSLIQGPGGSEELRVVGGAAVPKPGSIVPLGLGIAGVALTCAARKIRQLSRVRRCEQGQWRPGERTARRRAAGWPRTGGMMP